MAGSENIHCNTFRVLILTRLSRLQLSCQDLLPLFEKYGDVGDIYLPIERGSGRSRGFAFVRYYDKRDAEVSVCLLCIITMAEDFP